MGAREVGAGADVDRALVEAMATGDREALGQLYDRWAPILLGLAVRMLGETGASEDLVHDVFIEVWRHAGEFDASRGGVRAWLVTRLRSRALDRLKSRAARRVGLTADGAVPEQATAPEVDPFERVAGADEARAVRRALAALPEAQRVVLTRAYFRGQSASEIAAELGVPIGTVKSRTAAAFAKLRLHLAAELSGVVPGEGVA